MNRPLQIGDWVQVVKGHECTLGRVFQIRTFVPQKGGGWFCMRCNTPDIGKGESVGAAYNFHSGGIPTGWLTRLPDIREPATDKTAVTA